VMQMVNTTNYGTAFDVSTCTPDDVKWPWPSIEKATGLWKRVVDSGELKVAGVQWSNEDVADYKTDPNNPSGFWPTYLQMVVDEINKHYGTDLPKPIEVKRVYFPKSSMVTNEVMRGEEVDVSEPYYYINGFNDNQPRIEVMDFSCVTLGSLGHFFTKKGSGITTIDGLVAAISAVGENSLTGRQVGFIGDGNWHSNSDLLPSNTVAQLDLQDQDQLEAAVLNGDLVAAYLSEGFPANIRTDFEVFPTGFMSPRAFLFRKDIVKSGDEGGSSGNTGLIAALVALASTVLVLVVLLAAIIVRERSGNPYFMALLDKSGEPSNM